MRSHAGDICAIEMHLSLARRVHARDAIEQSGFACAIGANEGGNFALIQGKRHVVQGGDATKTHGQMGDAQHGELHGVDFPATLASPK